MDAIFQSVIEVMLSFFYADPPPDQALRRNRV